MSSKYSHKNLVKSSSLEHPHEMYPSSPSKLSRTLSFDKKNIRPVSPHKPSSTKEEQDQKIYGRKNVRRSSSMNQIYEPSNRHTKSTKQHDSFLLLRYLSEKRNSDKDHKVKQSEKKPRAKGIENDKNRDSHSGKSSGYLSPRKDIAILSTKEYVSRRRQEDDLLLGHIKALEKSNFVSNPRRKSLDETHRHHVSLKDGYKKHEIASVVKTKSYGSLWYNKIKHKKVKFPTAENDNQRVKLQLSTRCSDLFAETLKDMGYDVRNRKKENSF